MKILCTWNNEIRDNGTCHHAYAALKELEAEGVIEKVGHMQPRGDVKGDWDAFIYVDDGRDDLKWLPPHPWAYWAIDTHLGYGYRLWKAGLADLVFTAQKDAVTDFEADGIKRVQWLPLACNPARQNTAAELEAKGCEDVKREWDFCFVGFMQDERQPGFNNRIDYLDTLFRAYPRSWLSANVFFEPMAQRFVKSRVGFNISIKRDLNMRVFEIMSTGTPLLTNRNVEGIGDLFTEDQDYFGYEDLTDLEAAADKVMMMSDLTRESIAANAFRKVRSLHTYKHRMQTIIEGLKNA